MRPAGHIALAFRRGARGPHGRGPGRPAAPSAPHLGARVCSRAPQNDASGPGSAQERRTVEFVPLGHPIRSQAPLFPK